MSDATIVPEDPKFTPPVNPAPRRARSHVGRLVTFVVAAGVAGVGFWRWSSTPPGGTVDAIKLTTKRDVGGQARDALDSITPTTADLYLVIEFAGDRRSKTSTFADMPIGSGLTWRLDAPVRLGDVELIEVWDRRRIIGDKQLDRVAFEPFAWSARGQTFELTALGVSDRPPPWALPVGVAGATLAGLILLRFVWDQAI